MAAELEQKVARYPNARNATISRRIFTRTAGAAIDGVRHHTLASLYGA